MTLKIYIASKKGHVVLTSIILVISNKKIRLQNLKDLEKLEKEGPLFCGWFIIYGIIKVSYNIPGDAFIATKIPLK